MSNRARRNGVTAPQLNAHHHSLLRSYTVCFRTGTVLDFGVVGTAQDYPQNCFNDTD